ncbi:hypothetical protein GCM10008014_46070 [Paenibacillus silvae]|uniref:Uncharacterized protein n=1 Tax=Paenibacillus silvae TaxID=1325358 RepID=A0ABQ1ZJK7_9BACL|nr:hypothetical protein GCM10008014_46070 [Paenibacillus silvae]
MLNGLVKIAFHYADFHDFTPSGFFGLSLFWFGLEKVFIDRPKAVLCDGFLEKISLDLYSNNSNRGTEYVDK